MPPAALTRQRSGTFRRDRTLAVERIVHVDNLVLLGGYIHNEIEIFSFPGISYIHDEELLRTLSSPDGETVA